MSEDQVRQIRDLASKGWTEREIAHKVGVSRSSVWAVKQGISFRSVR